MLSAFTPPPVTSSSSSTNTHSPASHPDSGCCSGDKNCSGCLKGGLPMRKELSSFLMLFFLGTAVVLGVLLINAKREMLSQSTTTPTAATDAKSAVTTELPKVRTYAKTIALPKPKLTGPLDLEAALAQRRTRREFSDQPVTLAELSQMLWAGQGVTDPTTGKRTAPSAHETYYYSIFVSVKDMAGLEPGLYEYLPDTHALGDMQIANPSELLTGAGVQEAAQKAPVVFLLSAAYGKGTQPPALLEAGHIGQNLYLQAESLKMATVAMAGFDATKVGTALKLDPAETVVYLYPFGHQGTAATTEE